MSTSELHRNNIFFNWNFVPFFGEWFVFQLRWLVDLPQFSLLSFRFCLFSEKERGKIELQSFEILHRKKKSFTSPFFICTQISRNQFVNLTSSLKRGRQIYISGFVCLAYKTFLQILWNFCYSPKKSDMFISHTI